MTYTHSSNYSLIGKNKKPETKIDLSGIEEIKEESPFIPEKNIIIGNEGRIIATVGVSNLIIVETEEGLLICNKDDSQHIKKIAKELEKL